MIKKSGKPISWRKSVGVRLLIIVCLALLPVSALSIWQGIERIRSDQASVRQTLRESARAAASEQFNVFAAAEKLLATLAKQDDIRLGRKACQRQLEDSARGLMFFGNLARVAANGTVLCAAVLPPAGFDVTKFSWWNEAHGRRDFFVAGPYYSEALHKNVFAGIQPLVGVDGAFDGTLNVAINVEWLSFVQEPQPRLKRGSLVALFDKSGTIVASNAPTIAPIVFAGGVGTAKHVNGLRSAVGPNDENWSLAIEPVVRHDFYVGFAMRDADLTRLSYWHVAVDLLLPVLMILLASLAIWLATERLVVRWIDLLGRMSSAFAGGHYAIRPQALNDAPYEFRELGDTLSNMGRAVQERDQKIREALAQKESLIKEIHHRVKNTLQIVMSLLSLQSSRLSDPNAREALEQARARINALALAHRAIYELDPDNAVDLKPLLSDSVGQVQRTFEGATRKIHVRMEIASCRVSGDTAIPLLLFVNEAMTNAFKRNFPEQRTAEISISLQPGENERMDLVISDNGRVQDDGSEQQDGAIGERLMSALAKQVSGRLSTLTGEDGGTVVKLSIVPLKHDDERTK